MRLASPALPVRALLWQTPERLWEGGEGPCVRLQAGASPAWPSPALEREARGGRALPTGSCPWQEVGGPGSVCKQWSVIQP